MLAAALRLVGDTRRRAFLPCATPHLGHPVDAVRYQAARAEVLLDAPAAAEALEAFLYCVSPYLREALLLRYAGASAAHLTGLPERIVRSALPVAVRIAHLATLGLADTIALLIGKQRPPPSTPPCVTWLGSRLRPRASSSCRTPVRRPRPTRRDSISRCRVRSVR